MAESDTPRASFNLVDEAWLPCVRVDGELVELSLRRLLCEAHQIKDLSLDAPTQFPPILRLLLAITHRALGWTKYGQQPAQPRTEDDWLRLWNLKAWPVEQINGYLDARRHRFDLFDEREPFLQVAGLRTVRDETKPITLLIPHVAAGNNTPLFSAARDVSPPSLSHAEAARWLLHVFAYDTAAIKTGAADDPQVKAGKTTGNPTGPLGQIGGVFPTGRTLWHTLMFNLLVLDGDLSPAHDEPVWERGPLTPEWRNRRPSGLLDLYTWPSRRVRLIPDDSGVSRVLVCAGDRLDLSVLSALEPHTAWKRSENQQKKLKRDVVYMPVRFMPGRRLWRGLEAVLLAATTDGADRLRPRVLTQLGRSSRVEPLAREPIQVRAFGMTYGNQSAVIDETYADDLPLPIVLLTEADDKVWEAVAIAATNAADAAGSQLAGLAANLGRAAGCSDKGLLDGRRTNARARLNAALDQPFRRWIADLGAVDEEPGQALTRWCAIVRAHAVTLAEDMLARVPDSAVHGHPVVNGPNESMILTAAQAEAWFWPGLSKALAVGRQEQDAA